MRKFGVVILFSLILIGIPFTKVKAACTYAPNVPLIGISCQKDPNGDPTKDQIACQGSGLTGYCCDPTVPASNVCPTGTASIAPAGGSKTYSVCDSIPDSQAAQKASCQACMGQTDSGQTPGSWTAIGCIHTDPTSLLSYILRIGIGLAGGIAFLLILFGGLQIMTSAGNPEQLNAGRELVTSAITGLLLVIFSIFLLQFIGINIIGIPGFTQTSVSNTGAPFQ